MKKTRKKIIIFSILGIFILSVQEVGLTGPMYHQQNKMFVDYINSLNPEAFKKLVLAVQKGESFSPSFLTYIEMSPEEMWKRFKSELL